jgi:hypothetical protein
LSSAELKDAVSGSKEGQIGASLENSQKTNKYYTIFIKLFQVVIGSTHQLRKTKHRIPIVSHIKEKNHSNFGLGTKFDPEHGIF